MPEHKSTLEQLGTLTNNVNHAKTAVQRYDALIQLQSWLDTLSLPALIREVNNEIEAVREQLSESQQI